jgi:hypothetical protein
MAGAKNSKEQGQDWPLLTAHQQSLFETMAGVGETKPDDRNMALISKALMLCPLPFRKTQDRQIVSETQVSGGSITTVLTALDDKILLPYGLDAFVLDALSSEARRRRSPIITTDNLAELMRMLKMEEVGGADYKLFLARIQRIGAFALRIKRRGVLALNARIVDVDGSEFWNKNDVRREKRGERKVIPGVVKLADEYFQDIMNQYAAVPLEILDALSANPTSYSLGKWLWYRSEVSETETMVPWDNLLRERGSKDSNVQRFKAKVRGTLNLMGPSRPEVKCLFKAEAKGLRITPIDALRSVEKPLL